MQVEMTIANDRFLRHGVCGANFHMAAILVQHSQVPQPTCYRKWHSWQLGNLTRFSIAISSFMSLHIQMFKVVNCSNFDANWSSIIISQFACSKNYHSTESIWTFQFGLRAKNLLLGIIIHLLFSVYKQLSLKKTEHFAPRKNIRIVYQWMRGVKHSPWV